MNKVILIFLITISSTSAFFLEAGLGLGLGDAETTETSTQTYDHESFSLGYSADVRAGLNILILDLGVTASYGKNPAKFTRKDVTTSIFNEVRYDVTFSHLLYGGHVGIKVLGDKLKVFAEYYPNVTSKVTYSEPKAENIFGKNDEYEGSGFGVGLGYSASPFVRLQGIYRKLTFDKLTTSNGVTNLPSATQSKLDMDMFYAGLTFFL
ncbi:MAG: outer membrane beta-barrel protein [Oligoflexia bacterium]|nr:outer membrane beta-barrel protein [Oligoflexia bacterium]